MSHSTIVPHTRTHPTLLTLLLSLAPPRHLRFSRIHRLCLQGVKLSHRKRVIMEWVGWPHPSAKSLHLFCCRPCDSGQTIGRPLASMPKGRERVQQLLTLLRHMQHQELWRAVGTHYGPTRIYGPTGHAIEGTAQQTLQSFYRSYRIRASALSVTTTGRQRSVGARTSPRRRSPCDSHESTTGLRCS